MAAKSLCFQHSLRNMAESSGAWDTSQEDEAGGAVVNDSIEKLFYAWRTEVNAPDILPFKQELVEEMQELLKNQEVWQTCNPIMHPVI